MKHRSRYVGLILVFLFVCSSLASPDLFVLCTGEGETARIEQFHLAQGVCAVKAVGRCCRSGGSPAELHHLHLKCTDVGLSGNLGLVKEREKAPELVGYGASASPVPQGDISRRNAAAAETYICSLSNHAPGIDLRSVVLLI
jgi:hypothetical protein